jgi:hypothetical protein
MSVPLRTCDVITFDTDAATIMPLEAHLAAPTTPVILQTDLRPNCALTLAQNLTRAAKQALETGSSEASIRLLLETHIARVRTRL